MDAYQKLINGDKPQRSLDHLEPEKKVASAIGIEYVEIYGVNGIKDVSEAYEGKIRRGGEPVFPEYHHDYGP